jgi:hypothetical protein
MDGGGFVLKRRKARPRWRDCEVSPAIARRTADTFGRDVEEMISHKLTFDEAVNAADFTIMAKQRLRVIQRDLFEQLDTVGLS